MKGLLMLALACWPMTASSGDGPSLKTRTELIRSNDHTFSIQVDGTLDPENVEITIENAGDLPVKNPRVTVNGKYNWYTLEGMVAEITQGAASDEEKAMAIFRFVTEKSYWWTFPKDRSSLNPVRHFNIYGYHICSQAAEAYVALCRAAGLDARVWEIWHHTVAEAKWNGAWHHMDADLGLWYLKDDNRTIASMEDLEKHPEWVERSYKPYRSYLSLDNRKMIYEPGAEPGKPIFAAGADVSGEDLADLYSTSESNYIFRSDDGWMFKPQSMDFTLCPDEKLIRWWKPVLHKYYDQATTQEPPRYANGQIVFEPDFTKRAYEGIVKRRNLKFKAEDGVSPAAHVDRIQDRVHDQPSMLAIPLRSPYVIVGGYIDTAYYKGGVSRLDQVSLSADMDPVLGEHTPLWNYYWWGFGMGEARAVLDQKLVKGGPVATYEIRAVYSISADQASAKPAAPPLVYGGQSGVDRVRLVADLQVNPDSLPALSLGNNTIHYTDDTAEPHALKITYKWRERFDRRASFVPAAMVPSNGVSVDSLAPRLEWSAPHGPAADGAANYRVQVSLRPDCAWPLASALDRDVREGPAFQVPGGWLNHGTTYYWRVRAEDALGAAGPWSSVARFVTR